jgi:prepilin-type N-terminal cleavage/methylation domain-containing protein
MPSCPAAPSRCRSPGRRGFSLIELLIASAIGAALLVTLAATAQLLSEQVAEVDQETDAKLHGTLAMLSREVRHAWSVDVPASDRLLIQDPDGDVTEYFLENDALKVLRPSGAEGVLLSGLQSFDLDATFVPRLREDDPLDLVQTCWTAPASTGTASVLTLAGGQSVAIGFTLPAAASDGFNTADGVDEQVQTTQLSRLLLPIGFLDGGNPQFCHLHAVPPHNPTHPSGQGSVTLTLYEARAPGDARPIGAALASTSITAGALPQASYYWYDRLSLQVVSPPSGVAWGWWDWFQDNWQVMLVINTAISTVPVDLGGLNAQLRPATAYTLVLSVAGYDQITLATRALASSKLSGFAYQSGAASSWQPQARTVSCTLEGRQFISQTSEEEAVSGVVITLETTDGQRQTRSVNVAGEVAVTEPWFGVLPGEVAGSPAGGP